MSRIWFYKLLWLEYSEWNRCLCACGYWKLHVQSLQSTVSKSMAIEGPAAFEMVFTCAKNPADGKRYLCCATYWLLGGENSGVHFYFFIFYTLACCSDSCSTKDEAV